MCGSMCHDVSVEDDVANGASSFSSFMWALGIRLRWLGMVRAFICRAISLALFLSRQGLTV